jgi:hypothetical protein
LDVGRAGADTGETRRTINHWTDIGILRGQAHRRERKYALLERECPLALFATVGACQPLKELPSLLF